MAAKTKCLVVNKILYLEICYFHPACIHVSYLSVNVWLLVFTILAKINNYILIVWRKVDARCNVDVLYNNQ